MNLTRSQVHPSEGEALRLDAYQDFTAISDRSDSPGMGGLDFVLLGLFGEVGSLLSALKKKKRDKDAYSTYEDSVLEEIGDALWYLANAAGRGQLSLAELGRRAVQRQDYSAMNVSSIQCFADLQPTHFSPALQEAPLEACLIQLAAKTGALLDSFAAGKFEQNLDRFSADLIDVFRSLIQAANLAHVPLDLAARRNIAKSEGRWPQEKTWAQAFDVGFPQNERFPRKMSFRFDEIIESDGRTRVRLSRDGNVVGDKLTDNRWKEDDYRFHDIFHLAHAAILGWSPTLRSLLRAKRKSNQLVDENEDGARASLIEEGIASWVFNHAERAKFFRSTTSLDFNILKTIQDFVQGYEVQVLPAWQWELAILEGFKAFRLLKEHRRGIVDLDLDAHTLEFRQVHSEE